MTITATDSTVTPTVGSTAGSTVLNPSPGQASATFTLTVNPAPLAITPAALPGGIVGQAYAASLSGTGGVGPYTWAVTSGSLPAGLTLNPNTGAITGTPTAAGSSPIGITVTDSSNPTPATASGTFSVTVNPGQLPLAIATGSLPAGTVSQPYSATVLATGGTTPYSWSATGLPAGLNLNTATGVLSGTPTRAGTFTVTVKAADSSKPTGKVSATLTLTVNPKLAVAAGALPGRDCRTSVRSQPFGDRRCRPVYVGRHLGKPPRRADPEPQHRSHHRDADRCRQQPGRHHRDRLLEPDPGHRQPDVHVDGPAGQAGDRHHVAAVRDDQKPLLGARDGHRRDHSVLLVGHRTSRRS